MPTVLFQNDVKPLDIWLIMISGGRIMLWEVCRSWASHMPNVWHWDDVSCDVVLRLINSLRPRQNGRRFADDIFKCIFLNENVWKPIKISLKFVPKGPINNIPALVRIMAWRRPGDKPLSEINDGLFTDAYMRHSAACDSRWKLQNGRSWHADRVTWKHYAM